MGKNTGIEWAHHTFNPWWGCVKVSPGCANCYAETWSHRTGHDIWGVDKERRFFSERHWNDPLRWNRAARKVGERQRVFSASMADLFEDRPDLEEPRRRLFDLIGRTEWLDWLLLTKRPENIERMVPEAWMAYEFPKNVWMGTSAEDDKRLNERMRHLMAIPAHVRWLSAEPLLGSLSSIRQWLVSRPLIKGRLWFGGGGQSVTTRLGNELYVTSTNLVLRKGIDLHWVVVGGESGPGARPMQPNWVWEIYAACGSRGVPFFFKQWGAHNRDGERVGKKAAGREFDGREHDEFPVIGDE